MLHPSPVSTRLPSPPKVQGFEEHNTDLLELYQSQTQTFNYWIQTVSNLQIQDPVLMQPFTIGSSPYATLYYRIQSLCNPLL